MNQSNTFFVRVCEILHNQAFLRVGLDISNSSGIQWGRYGQVRIGQDKEECRERLAEILIENAIELYNILLELVESVVAVVQPVVKGAILTWTANDNIDNALGIFTIVTKSALVTLVVSSVGAIIVDLFCEPEQRVMPGLLRRSCRPFQRFYICVKLCFWYPVCFLVLFMELIPRLAVCKVVYWTPQVVKRQLVSWANLLLKYRLLRIAYHFWVELRYFAYIGQQEGELTEREIKNLRSRRLSYTPLEDASSQLKGKPIMSECLWSES
jgi:hypothetical protein